jgi:hypothetical protein
MFQTELLMSVGPHLSMKVKTEVKVERTADDERVEYC